jgi:hypothetical protein
MLWDVVPNNPLKGNGHFAFIFRFEENSKQETTVNAGGKQNSLPVPCLHFFSCLEDASAMFHSS